MGQIVELELEDGTIAYVEAQDAGGLEEMSGDEDRPRIEFDRAIDAIRPMAQALMQNLQAIASPDDVQLEFSLSLDTKTRAFVFSADARAAFKVTLGWKRGTDG